MAILTDSEDDLNRRSDSSTSALVSPQNPPIPEIESDPKEEGETRVYLIRYYYLVVSCLLHVCWNFCFLTYTPVASSADAFYGKGTATATSVIFMAVSTVACTVEMWFSRLMGLRWVIWSGYGFMTLGTAIRCFSLVDGMEQDTKRILVEVGQAVTAIGGPFAMFLPTKVAAAWFAPNQRALATSLMSISGPFGILLINLVAPAIVKQKEQIFGLNLVVFGLCAIGLTLALVGVRQNKPPIPPSRNAARETLPFFTGLKQCLTNPAYVLIVICLGGGLGLFNTVYTTAEQFLCVKGYSTTFSGVCVMMMIAGGIIFAIIAGIIADRTKLFVEILKLDLPLAVLFGIIFSILTKFYDIEGVLVVILFLFGGFGTTFYAIGMEMSAECTYPVEETTTAGILGMSGNIQGTIYVILFDALAKPLRGKDIDTQVCGVDDDNNPTGFDPRLSFIVFDLIAVILVLLFVPFFNPQYKRMRLEIDRQSEQSDSVYTVS